MRSSIICIGLVMLAACSSGSARQEVRLASLSFELPADWTHSEIQRPGSTTVVWTPEANQRKESVTIVRTERARLGPNADRATLERLLRDSQRALLPTRTSEITPISTPRGLSGVRVELDYVPPGVDRSYRRVHIVLVEGDGDAKALVHVLYTAATPNLDALDMLLASIRHEEA